MTPREIAFVCLGTAAVLAAGLWLLDHTHAW